MVGFVFHMQERTVSDISEDEYDPLHSCMTYVTGLSEQDVSALFMKASIIHHSPLSLSYFIT